MDYSNSVPNISLPIDSIVQITFLFTLLVIIIFSIILYYHWEQYAMNKKVKNLTYIIYIIITLPLLSLMGILAFIL